MVINHSFIHHDYPLQLSLVRIQFLCNTVPPTTEPLTETKLIAHHPTDRSLNTPFHTKRNLKNLVSLSPEACLSVYGTMNRTRRLLTGDITFSTAVDDQSNILHALSYYEEMIKFLEHLRSKRRTIERLAGEHLALASSDICRAAQVKDWRWGTFNVCVPLCVRYSAGYSKKVMMRFPFPFRTGEAFRPGNVDEKVRCEGGTYVWLQNNCPEVPIPRLYGFGLSSGLRVILDIIMHNTMLTC